jgi:hypothetical protein
MGKGAISGAIPSTITCRGTVPVIACHDEIVVERDAGQAEAVAAWPRHLERRSQTEKDESPLRTGSARALDGVFNRWVSGAPG